MTPNPKLNPISIIIPSSHPIFPFKSNWIIFTQTPNIKHIIQFMVQRQDHTNIEHTGNFDKWAAVCELKITPFPAFKEIKFVGVKNNNMWRNQNCRNHAICWSAKQVTHYKTQYILSYLSWKNDLRWSAWKKTTFFLRKAKYAIYFFAKLKIMGNGNDFLQPFWPIDWWSVKKRAF